MLILLLLACDPARSEPAAAPAEAAPPAAAPYWVQRSDRELDDALRATCERATAAGQPVLLAFSAPWCSDCNRVRQLEGEDPLHSELAGWQELVVDVGRFDRHTALLEHFGVEGIAHWVALRPESCVVPVTRWRVLRSGRFEPASNAAGPRTAADLAAWLVAARGG
jgi:thiol:disulfide interchange protein